jgi:hypothetical protein
MVLRSVLQAFDEYHSLISRAKGLAGMAENVRQGWRAGGRAPRGYTLDYTATGAVRDGAPVLKSRLVIDDQASPLVAAYLAMRARGVPRGTAVAKLALPWPTSSTQSMDWQALTYAGHTVWGMHAERMGTASINGDKRRPRHEWQIQRNTHPALITDDQAEAILKQLEDGQQGRRLRASPLLLTGMLVDPAGQPWQHDDAHSDGSIGAAAACYAAPQRPDGMCPGYWPWAASWWKPKDRRSDLVRAGALILAEIERLDRAAVSGAKTEGGM